MIVTTGNKGDKDRSDCFVSLKLTKSGGIQIDLQSKVKSLYGDSIVLLCKEVLKFFNLKHVILKIEDKGALPFVLAARLEAAIKKQIKTDKEFLLEMLPENINTSSFDQHRITRLYLPGNTPSLMINAGIHKPDGIILDLEDAVAVDKKNEARFLVRNALRNLNFMGVERMVRINQIPAGLEDLEYIIPHNVNLVLVPKCESADQLHKVNQRIVAIQKKSKMINPVWLMPIIESAMGVIKAFEIAQAADNVVAIAIGLEDYTADLGVNRTNEGIESLFARCQIINACKAVGIQAIDSVFSSVDDIEALKENVHKSKALGFEGMGCIHPRQIKVIRDNFAPNEKEIDNAKKIVIAFIKATEEGLGVVSLGSKMIDAPIVKRAQRIIDLAVSLGKLDINWKNQTNE
ncbi:aldolase/citrate lyase family protein [Lutibacter sp.]|uniref:aldolase/citrate lyase family protein n=1 Tax=Lutibacter sp. TaxID=1925666 RepID=UPI00273763B6|nr:aldolase/citrate lyase family protein [Lutibacter sp.]MDP3313128.1 aldolase/citrate lyase family protein [Lutibacter sp.]